MDSYFGSRSGNIASHRMVPGTPTRSPLSPPMGPRTSRLLKSAALLAMDDAH